MTTLFSRIIDGELPGRFVWRDESAVAFLSINPLRPGHTLVVPRVEVDDWLDLDPAVPSHLMTVAQTIGIAQRKGLGASRVALIIAGLEVPHVHLHVFPMVSEADLNFRRADPSPTDASMDDAAARIRDALRADGHREVAD